MRNDQAVAGDHVPTLRGDEIDVAGLTHRGLVRPDNQDHFLVCSLRKSARVHATSLPTFGQLDERDWMAYFGMVADGVGGAAGGETASRAAIEDMPAYVNSAFHCFNTHDPTDDAAFVAGLEAAAQMSHEAVLARARANPRLSGMATTLTMIMTVWPMCYLLQVGDSRCYRLSQGRLEQLSRDQTVSQQLIDEGTALPEQVLNSPMANILTSSIGGTSQPVVSRVQLARGDVLLLCTDGLTKHVPAHLIARRLREMRSAEQACRVLVQDALDGGGTDNVTVVVGCAVRRPGGAIGRHSADTVPIRLDLDLTPP